jgi:predicted Zn-dependent protease
MRRILATAIVIAGAAAVMPAARGESRTPFRFTKVDLKLLEECAALDRQLESRALVYHDVALEKHLADLAAPLLPSAPLEHVAWKFRILRDPMVNAFALPNGSVYVFSGLLARAENDDQLAGVLAHEATHVTNRHAYEFNRSVRKKTVAAEVVAVAAEWTPVGGLGGWAVAAAANMSQFAIATMVYGYSRQLEEEADRNAVDRVRQAGRDPMQIIRMFAIMDQRLEPEPVPYTFRDHPPIKERIAYLKEVLGADRDVAPGSDGGYLDRMRTVILQNIQLDLDSRRFRSAVAAAERLATAHPDDPAALYWLGESYRSLGPRQPRLTVRELTDGGLRTGYRHTVRRTEEEDTQSLSGTPEGRAALEANQGKAEELFRKASAIDPSLPETYLGLGALYEEQGKPDEAIRTYRKYIDLSKRPAEKERVERRIEELKKRSQAAPKGESK